MINDTAPQNLTDDLNEEELNEKQPAALEYLRRGIATVPCRGKSPFTKDWNRLPRPTEEELITAFTDPTLNIGARTGAISGGLIDVDIDSAVAAHIASRFLPRTGAVYGRQSRPSSHWQYFERDRSSVFPSVFKGPDGKNILEIRGEYQQSIVPPSTHVDTGEAIEWAGDGLPGEPAVINDKELYRWCGYLSATVIIGEILATHPGQRHGIVLHLAGGFATHNLPRDIAERIIDEAAS